MEEIATPVSINRATKASPVADVTSSKRHERATEQHALDHAVEAANMTMPLDGSVPIAAAVLRLLRQNDQHHPRMKTLSPYVDRPMSRASPGANNNMTIEDNLSFEGLLAAIDENIEEPRTARETMPSDRSIPVAASVLGTLRQHGPHQPTESLSPYVFSRDVSRYSSDFTRNMEIEVDQGNEGPINSTASKVMPLDGSVPIAAAVLFQLREQGKREPPTETLSPYLERPKCRGSPDGVISKMDNKVDEDNGKTYTVSEVANLKGQVQKLGETCTNLGAELVQSQEEVRALRAELVALKEAAAEAEKRAEVAETMLCLGQPPKSLAVAAAAAKAGAMVDTITKEDAQAKAAAAANAMISLAPPTAPAVPVSACTPAFPAVRDAGLSPVSPCTPTTRSVRRDAAGMVSAPIFTTPASTKKLPPTTPASRIMWSDLKTPRSQRSLDDVVAICMGDIMSPWTPLNRDNTEQARLVSFNAAFDQDDDVATAAATAAYDTYINTLTADGGDVVSATLAATEAAAAASVSGSSSPNVEVKAAIMDVVPATPSVSASPAARGVAATPVPPAASAMTVESAAAAMVMLRQARAFSSLGEETKVNVDVEAEVKVESPTSLAAKAMLVLSKPPKITTPSRTAKAAVTKEPMRFGGSGKRPPLAPLSGNSPRVPVRAGGGKSAGDDGGAVGSAVGGGRGGVGGVGGVGGAGVHVRAGRGGGAGGGDGGRRAGGVRAIGGGRACGDGGAVDGDRRGGRGAGGDGVSVSVRAGGVRASGGGDGGGGRGGGGGVCGVRDGGGRARGGGGGDAGAAAAKAVNAGRDRRTSARSTTIGNNSQEGGSIASRLRSRSKTVGKASPASVSGRATTAKARRNDAVVGAPPLYPRGTT